MSEPATFKGDALKVGIIGHNFMGRAHSNAWLQSARFFDLPLRPQLQVACGRNAEAAEKFAKTWGWAHVETDWRKVVTRADVDVIDIATPQSLHCEIAVEAARNGKHVICEKPVATNLADAQAMLLAAEQYKVRHFINHNYRRAPAIALAKQLIDEGRIGRIFHWRGSYQQDWIVDPNFPLTWQLRRELAGAGPHADLNSHSVDLAHYLVGDIASVTCLTEQFISKRPLPAEDMATFANGNRSTAQQLGDVTVEDASLMLARFSNGAIGSFEATRFASGRKNANCFEIYGSEGSLRFDLERMNELEYFCRQDEAHVQGYRRLLATESCHPYVKHWWPPGHILGYEHTFIHGIADFIHAIAAGTPIEPNFRDGVKVMAVLDAGLKSANSDGRLTPVILNPNST